MMVAGSWSPPPAGVVSEVPLEALARLTAERDEAREFGEKAAKLYNDLLAKGETLTCAFCGHVYPPGTPPTQNEELTAHVHECPKHPLRARAEEAERSLLAVREALRKLCWWVECPECGAVGPHGKSCPIGEILDATSPQAAEVERRLRDEGFRSGQESMREDAINANAAAGAGVTPDEQGRYWKTFNDGFARGIESYRNAIRALPIKERADA